MPISRRGDMFEAPGMHIVTASSSLSQDGTLMMGLGAAYAMKAKYPHAPKLFGTMISEYCGDGGTYGLLLFGTIGILQVKYTYNGKYDVPVIQYGLNILHAIAQGQPGMTFNLIHPGVQYGKSTMPAVEKMIMLLPDNVAVWEKG